MENVLTEERLTETLLRHGIVAEDPKLRAIFQNVLYLADLDASILILGESGTGKDCIAKLIHQCGRRAAHPFVRLNCAAIPSELFESELFGYEGSTFTGGLYAGKEGLLEAANGGTIFLDEIGEMTQDNQVKLLRFLETKQNMRLGANSTRTLDVRVVSATHRNLRKMIEQGQFRRDLYYRICGVTLSTPPLRERPYDVAALAETFLSRLAAEQGRKKHLTPEGLAYLQSLPWPGNVRQLQNVLERVCVLEDSVTIDPAMLRRSVGEVGVSCEAVESRPVQRATLMDAVADFEREYIKKAVEETNSLVDTARVLGLNLATLYRKKRQYGIYKRRHKAGASGQQDGTPIA